MRASDPLFQKAYSCASGLGSIGSLTDLARRPSMPGEAILRRLIALHADFPVLRHGTFGRKYQIDIEAAEAFVLRLAECRGADPEARHALIRQIGLEMVAAREGQPDGK
nr:hypothetical protein [Sphingomonas populi]